MSIDSFNDWSMSVTALGVAILWQSALLTGLIAGVCWLLRRSTPILRYWCWQIIPLKLLLMPWWIVSISLPSFPGVGRHSESPVLPREGDRASQVMSGPATDTRAAPPAAITELAAVETASVFGRLSRISWSSWLVLAWLGGIALQLGCVLAQHTRLRRLMRRATTVMEPRLLALIDEIIFPSGKPHLA
jgi:hypothetical protein